MKIVKLTARWLCLLVALVAGLPMGWSPAAAAVETVLEAYFDAPQLPAGWTVTSQQAGVGWRFDDPGNRGNSPGGTGGFAIADSDYAGNVLMDTYLDTPALDLSAYAQVTLEFKTYYSHYQRTFAKVAVSADGGVTWVTVWEKGATMGVGEVFGGPVTLNLTAQAAGQANVKLRFHYGNATYAWYWQIDDVKLTGDTVAGPTPLPPTPTPAPLAAPSDLIQAGATQTQLALAWADNSANESGFSVERSPNGTSDWAFVGVTAANATSYTHSGLTCGASYHYRVRAYDAARYSAYSNVVAASTAACGDPPAAPSGLTQTGSTANALTLAWGDNSANEDGFKIERSPNGTSDWVQIGTTGAGVTVYSDLALACGSTLYYRVGAYNLNGNSGYSNGLTATTTLCPAVGTGLEERFDGTATPAGWSMAGSVGWRFDDPGARTNRTGGAGGFAIADSDKACSVNMDTELRAPALDLSSFAAATLRFRTCYLHYQNTVAAVDISVSGGVTWTNVWSTTANVCGREVLVDISPQAAGQSNVIARFRYYNARCAWYWQLDDVSITGFAGNAIPPAAPSTLQQTATDESSLSLSWTDQSTYEEGFRLERTPHDEGAWTPIGATGANVTAYSDQALACGAAYDYRVIAYNVAGASAPVTLTNATTGACVRLPAAPSHLTASGVTEESVTLGWHDNSINESGFQLETLRNGLWTQSPLMPAGQTMYTVTGLTCSQEYAYRLYALNADGNSAYTAILTATTSVCAPPAAPTGLQAAEIGATSVTLSWQDTSVNETGFTVERSPDGNTWATLAPAVNANQTTFVDAGLTCNTVYQYRVRAARAGVGDSAPSATLRVRTAACALLNEAFAGNGAPAAGPAGATLSLRLDEATGATTFTDASGNGYHATCSGAACPAAGLTGWYGAAANFDGNDTLEIPYNAALNTPSFTVAAWVKVSGGSGHRAVWTSRDLIKGHMLYVNPDNVWNFTVGNGVEWVSLSGAPATTGVWTHVAGVYDAISQTMRLYVNGQLAGNQTGVAFVPNTARPFRVGAGATEGAPQFHFNGLIDEVSVYARALSADEIRALTPPGGWRVVTANSAAGKPGWLPQSGENQTGGSGNSFMADRVAAGGVTRWDVQTALRTPVFDLSAYTQVTLTFRMAYQADAEQGQAQVEISTDGGATWTALRKFFATESTLDRAPLSVNLTPYAGLTNVQVQFAYHARNGGFWQVDDVSVQAATGDGVAPAAPSNLARAGGSETEVVLSWTDNSANEDGFVVERWNETEWAVVGVTGPDIATYTERNLRCNHGYFYRVRARNLAGFSAYTAGLFEATTAACTTPPATPGGLARTSATPVEITLAWVDRSDNEAGFKVERSRDGAAWQEVGDVTAQVTTFTDKGLFCNTAYRYRARAYNGRGYSAYTDEAWARTEACTDTLKPAAPTNFTATSAAETRLSLSWSDNSNNEIGFRIERSADGRDWTLANAVIANSTWFADDGLSCGATYHYRIYAYSAGGGNSDPLEGSATTVACPITLPNAPANLSASTAGESRLTLTWSDTSDNEDLFKLERSPNGQTAWAQITTLGPNATTYTDAGLTCNTAYHYRVRAYREGHGDSAYTSSASATTAVCSASPPKCNTPANGSIVLLDAAANPTAGRYRVLLEIQNPVITNKTAQGCNVSGSMHLILHSNNLTDIPITGKVDSYDMFRSDSIGHFSLIIAGVRLYTGEPWDVALPIPLTGLGKAPEFNGQKLTMNSAWLALPPEFGSGTVPLIKAPSISAEGLEFGQRIGLPKFPIGAVDPVVREKSTQYFGLTLAVELKFTSRGFELSGEGGLELPGVAGSGPGCSTLSAEGSLYINEATGQTMLEFQTTEDTTVIPLMGITDEGADVPLYPAPTEGPFMPNTPAGQPDWRGIGGKIGLAVKCNPGIPIAPYNLVVLNGVRGTVALGMEATSISVGATIYVMNPLLLSADGNARITVSPELSAQIEGKLKLFLFQMGYAKVSLSESDGFRVQGELRDPGIPLLKYEAALHAWVTGVQRQGGEITYNNPQTHLTGSGRIYMGIAKGEILEQEVYSPCLIETCQYTLAAPGWLATILQALGLPSSINLTYPCGINTRYVEKTYTFNYKTPRVVCPNGETYNIFNCWVWQTSTTWDPQSFSIPYPSRDAFESCPVKVSIPDQDWKSFDTLAEFGEFRSASSNSIWGLKGYAKILYMDYGFFVNFNNSMVDWVNAKSYSLVDSKQAQAARAIVENARRTYRPLTATEAALVAPYTFLADGGVIIATPNFDPPGYRPRAAFGPQDAITQTHVISRTDTLFGVMARVPLSMSLIAPDGVEITPVNYAAVPTYTVMYNELYTYTLERPATPALARWRFVPAATHPALLRVDLTLDGTTVYTEVSVQTGYLSLPAGEHVLGVVPAGATQPALLAPFTAAAGADYTLLSLGDAVSATLVLTDDNRSPQALGQARLRLVNAIFHDVDAMDVYVDETLLFEKVAYGAVSAYGELPAGDHAIRMVRAGTQDTLLASNVTLKAGVVYTFLTREWAGSAGGMAALFLSGDGGADGALPLWALAPVGSPSSYALMWDTMLDEVYIPVTTTQYAVDQATIGMWQVKLTGAITETGWALSVSGVENPPIISEFVVGYDNAAPEETEVALRLQADHAPTRLTFFVKPGAITETVTITNEQGITSTFTTPLFQGKVVDVITVTESELLDGSKAIVHTLDLFELETGDYSLWVQVEDGVSPAVNAYAALQPTTRAAQLALGPRTVNIAAESFDPFRALANTGVFHVNQTDWFTDELVAGAVITPELNVELWEWDAERQEWVFYEYQPLGLSWTPLWHPDADYQVVAIDEWLEDEEVFTETARLQTDFTVYDIYDENDEYVDSVSMAGWQDVVPDKTYYIAVGLLDLDQELALWSDYVEFTVPLGDFGLTWEPEDLEATFWPGDGYGEVETQVVLTMTDDLYYDLSLDFDYTALPEGIEAEILADDEELARMLTPHGKHAPSAAAPCPRCAPRVAQAVTQQINEELLDIVIYVDESVPDGWYTLPVVAAAGQETRVAEIEFNVQQPTYAVQLSAGVTQTALAGQPLIYPHTFTNTGSSEDSYYVWAENDNDWDIAVVSDDGVWSDEYGDMEFSDVAPEESFSFEIHVTIPADAAPGTWSATEVIIVSDTDEESYDSVTDYTGVATPTVGLALSPGYTRQTRANTVVAYGHTLTNTGTCTETYFLQANHNRGWAIELLNPDWPAGTMPLWLFQVGPHDTRTFSVTVAVPAEAAGLTGQTILTATARSDASVLATATDVTLVAAAPGVQLTPNRSASAQPGAVVTYTHTLVNTGGAADTFDLTLSPGWGALVTPTPVTLASGGTATVNVRITAPTTAVSGTVETTRLTATSRLDSRVSATVTDTTTIFTQDTPPDHDIFLPLVLRND